MLKFLKTLLITMTLSFMVVGIILGIAYVLSPETKTDEFKMNKQDFETASLLNVSYANFENCSDKFQITVYYDDQKHTSESVEMTASATSECGQTVQRIIIENADKVEVSTGNEVNFIGYGHYAKVRPDWPELIKKSWMMTITLSIVIGFITFSLSYK